MPAAAAVVPRDARSACGPPQHPWSRRRRNARPRITRRPVPAVFGIAGRSPPHWHYDLVVALGSVIAVARHHERSRHYRCCSAAPKHYQGIVVLPFAADNPAQVDDPAFARVLTHDLIGYLSRFANLRVISEPTSEVYRDLPPDERGCDDRPRLADSTPSSVTFRAAVTIFLRIDFQLVDAATRTNVWSNDLERERGEPTLARRRRGGAWHRPDACDRD